MHIPLVYFVKQALQVRIGAVSGSCLIVVRHIIACVSEGGCKTGIHPDRITSQFLNIIQFFYDTLKITDTVTFGIQKRLGINFIKDCIIKPFCHILAPSLFFHVSCEKRFPILSFNIPQNGYLYNYEKTSIIK